MGLFVEAKALPNKTGQQIAGHIYDPLLRYGVFQVSLNDQGKY